MPYDATIGFQLSSLTNFTPVLGVYQAYPYKDANGDVASIAKFQEAADFDGHSMLDYEPKEWRYRSSTVTISSGVVTLAAGTWPTWAQGSQFFVLGEIYTVVNRNSGTTLTLSDLTVNAPALTVYDLRHANFRETDPSLTNMSAIAYMQWEFADAIMQVAQRAYDRGGKIGVYGELLTHQNARNQHVLDNPGDANLFRNWWRDVEKTAKLKCWGGLSLIDVFNSFGGKIYFPAYVPDAFISSTHNKNRYRRYIRRVAAVLRDMGAQPVPLILPYTLNGHGAWLSTGSGTRIPTDLLQGLVGDMENDQPGEWGVWGVQRNSGTENEADATFIAGLPS
jgi:hypothetical protein